MASPRKEKFDVCVIGTGAGGGVMLDELTRAGMSMVALERGPHLGPADFMDMMNCPTSSVAPASHPI